MNKLNLYQALSECLELIEGELNKEIIGIQRVTKIYGSNANSFILKTLENEYFLKFNDSQHLLIELEGTDRVSNYLPCPKLILTSNLNNNASGWILFQHVSGKLLTERYITQDINEDSSDLYLIEEAKERLLTGMYEKNRDKTTLYRHLNCRTNDLFQKRLQGPRFREFYADDPTNISNYFKYKISLNGHEFPNTIDDIFKNIQSSYNNLDPDLEINTILGHGDGHHGNIIVDDKDKIWFIDNEYSGQISSSMELAKPYYNDFVGELFFHYHDILQEYFGLESVYQTDDHLEINFKPKRLMDARLKITQIKLQYRQKYLQRSNDPISLNHYLVLCHTLTKNPNNYPEHARWLFVVFLEILSEFDPLDPESIYKFF